MKRRFSLGLICFLTLPLLHGVAADTARYFKTISPTDAPPADYYVSITSVTANESASKAGMHNGDRIVGVDGLRTRGRREYYFIRFFYDRRPTISFTLSNAGKLREITCRDISPIRRCGFNFDDHVPDFFSRLSGLGMDIDSLSDAPKILRPAAAKTNSLMMDMFDSFGIEEAKPVFGIRGTLESFPMRGQDAVRSVLGRHNPGDSEWISGLLKVYLLLVQQRYDDARQVIAAKKLTDREVEPFLNRLLRFYQVIIDRPPSRERTFQLADYDVDVAFFVFCYPYPIIYNKTADSFGYDPAFQQLFDKATAANRNVFENELKQAAARYAKMTKGTDVECYMGIIRGYLLSAAQYPGWQWLQESKFWQPESRREIMAELKERKSAQQGDTIETAFALLTAAALENDSRTLEDAYTTVYEAGAREAALGRKIISAVVAWYSRNTSLMTVCERVGSTMQLPPFYDYLRTVSPVFDFGKDRRPYHAVGPDVVDLREFCVRYPSVAAKALDHPLDPARIEKAVASALEGDDPAAANKALQLLSEKMAFRYQPEDMNTLCELGRKVGAGRVMDAMMYVMAYHDLTVLCVDSSEMNLDEIDYDYIHEVERQYYKTITDKLKTISNNDPNLPQMVEKYYEIAGVPSICLVLARKLTDAGHADLADKYVGKARKFHSQNVTPYMTPTRSLALCRDFASMPGFEKESQMFGVDFVARANALAAYMLFAAMDVYRGNVDSAIEYLIKSLFSKTDEDEFFLIYNSVPYSSLDEMRKQMMRDIVTNNKLTDKQIGRLKQFPSLGLDAALNAASTAKP